MTSVSRKEGFRYGFYVFAYWLVLLVFSAALVAAGGYIVEMQNLGDVGLNEDTALAVLGGFVALLGVLAFGSGQVGLVYKVVADGVSVGSGAGNRNASGSVTDSEGTPVGTDTPTADDETSDEPAPRPRERSAQPRDSAESRDGAREQPDPHTANQSGDEERPTRRDRPDEETTGQPRARSATETPDDGHVSETPGDEPTSGEQPGRQTGEGSRTADDDPEPADRESPADVANESEIAEELGFEESDESGDGGAGGSDAKEDPTAGEERPAEGSAEGPTDTVANERDGRTTEDVETAETVIDPDAGETDADGETVDDAAESDDTEDASALDWGGSETTGNATETTSTDADEPETGTGSLADALADEDPADDGPSGGEGAPVDEDDDDGENPRWTTGEDHEGGPGQGDGR